MNVDLIFANIAKHIYLDPAEKAFVKTHLLEKKVAKKDYILHQGEPCTHISFVNSGLLRAYYLSKEGKDSTIMFAMQDWWVTDMYCFVNQKPAMVSIQAMETCNILMLSKDSLETLYQDVPKFEKLFRILMQNAYCREQLRSIQNLSLSAKERHDQFLAKYPQIYQRVAQKYIASYLGVTPEFLSFIRGKKE